MDSPREATSGSCSFCGGPAERGLAWRGARATVCAACVEDGLAVLLGSAREPATRVPIGEQACGLCSMIDPARPLFTRNGAFGCGACLLACAGLLVGRTGKERAAPANQGQRISERLEEHFAGSDVHALTTYSRLFPTRMRVEVQAGVDQALGPAQFGVRRTYDHTPLDFVGLLAADEMQSARVAPLQFVEVSVGEEEPRRCVHAGVWLLGSGANATAVLLAHQREYGDERGIYVELAARPGPDGGAAAKALFDKLEAAVREARAYRGKVLSLESDPRSYRGQVGGIMVHQLRSVEREELILAEETLHLLDRNVFGFHAQREVLRRLGLPLKKGLLLHGPPGTGKTHTLHYLASHLPQHTTLLMTAEEIEHLDEYMALARQLQPSMIVMEDADLIATHRGESGPGVQVMLNKLLNEMDGLREDAEILFVLTTNRPEVLEPALATRPGRIDQAIAFPLPNAALRKRLVALYSRGLSLSEPLMDEIARRTDRVSAAFIKELMRRVAQASAERGDGAAGTAEDVELALNEMTVGGRLNAVLVGGPVSGFH
jgi:ATPase family associated with various cellular activities (AAA)